MFMHLPCWSLPKAHRLLKKRGASDGMLIEPGYVKVLRMASVKGWRRPLRAAARALARFLLFPGGPDFLRDRALLLDRRGL